MCRINLGGISPRTQIPINESLNETIKLDFSYFCFKGIKTLNFTNFFRNEKKAFEYQLKFFHKFIPEVTQKTFIELGQNRNTHCHEITKKDKVFLINQILKEYIKNYLEFSLPNYQGFGDQFYQLSTNGGVRVIGFRFGDVFYILFVDCYHLIYPNKHYNSKDYSSYSFNEFDICHENLNVIDFQDLILDTKECHECGVLKKIIE